MSDEPITTQSMTFHCKDGHEWTETWPMPLLADQFTKRLKAASKCPRCAKTVFMGPNTRALDQQLLAP